MDFSIRDQTLSELTAVVMRINVTLKFSWMKRLNNYYDKLKARVQGCDTIDMALSPSNSASLYTSMYT